MANISHSRGIVIEFDEEVDQAAAIKALAPAEGREARVTHRLGPRVVVVAVDLSDDQVNERLPTGARLLSQEAVPNKEALTNPILLDAFRVRQSPAFRDARLRRPPDGQEWGKGDLLVPDVPDDEPETAANPELAVAQAPTAAAVPEENERLINEIAVGIVFVNGHGDYAISTEEKWDIVGSVIEGLDWLGAFEAEANVSWSYDARETVVDITPWEGARWPGLPDSFYSGTDAGFDAAFVREDNDKLYVFRGNQYVQYSNVSAGPDAGYPELIANGWPGLPASFQSGLDAAFWRESNGKIYFFKGKQYVRFSNASDGVDSGYPMDIAEGWPGLPESFQEGIDAVLMRKDNHKIYMFKGKQYVRFSNVSEGVDSGYPKDIAEGWRGMPESFQQGIDAALWRDSNSKIYLFKSSRFGGTYVRFTNVGDGVDPGYEKGMPIGLSLDEAESLWRDPALTALGFPIGVDGIKQYLADLKSNLNTQWAVCAFFTKHPTVWFAYAKEARIVMSYDNFNVGHLSPNRDIAAVMAHEVAHKFGAKDEYASSNCECKKKYGKFFEQPNGNCANCPGPGPGSFGVPPAPCIMRGNDYAMCMNTQWHIGWGAFMNKIDAAVWRNDNGMAYLFSNGKYVRFSDISAGRDKGYPKDIATAWLGLPPSFKQGIDAALWRAYNGAMYFFKGNQYVRFSNVDEGVDEGYPLPIAGNWAGLPAAFNNGIDAALWREDNGMVYLFKGKQYVRFTNVNEGVDAGYPKDIADGWRGMPASFNSGIDAALMRLDNHKIYFFKGTRYVRFTDVSSGMDSGYPAYINERWIPFPK